MVRIIRQCWHIPPEIRHAVIAIGNFDGLHLGHQAVIGRARALAQSYGCQAMVMSFHPHPRWYFSPSLPRVRMERLPERVRHLDGMGVGALLSARFDARLAGLSALDFAQLILSTALSARHVVTGEDFRYGHRREGDAARLAADLAMLGVGYDAVPSVELGGVRASSSQLRAWLKDGEMARASQMLGRAYSLSGRVRHGDKRGRELGFPTANIGVAPCFLPRFGVYAVRGRLEGGSSMMMGVANLGVRPTLGGDASPGLEAHFFDATGQWYGKRMEVELHHFIRPEQRFASLADLTLQLEKDSAAARRFWKEQT